MDWKPWQKKTAKQTENSTFSIILKQPFYFLSITTLSLLLPLSFLLLARLSSANFLISTQNDPSSQQPKASFLFSLFLYTNPALLHALVCIITLSSLIHTITGRITLLPDQPVRPRLHIAWIFLCTLQVCVGLGIEASIEAGIDGSGFSKKDRSLFNRAMFFVGIHETMMHWCRSVVKPVVDDTLWGGPKAESWMVRAALAAGCGGLWWMRMREEVESLVGVVELKMETMVWRIGFGDFLSWWLYYLVVTIGVARIFKGILWYVMVVVFKRREDRFHGESLVDVQDQV